MPQASELNGFHPPKDAQIRTEQVTSERTGCFSRCEKGLFQLSSHLRCRHPVLQEEGTPFDRFNSRFSNSGREVGNSFLSYVELWTNQIGNTLISSPSKAAALLVDQWLYKYTAGMCLHALGSSNSIIVRFHKASPLELLRFFRHR